MHGTFARQSSIEFIPFKREHFALLDLQPAQIYLRPVIDDERAGSDMEIPGYAWTGLLNGVVVGSAGVLPMWEGRGQCWALIGDIPRDQWIRVTGFVRQVLARAHLRGIWRIETTVLAGWQPGLRWVKALGFKPEGYLEGYDALGRDHVGFAHIDRIALAARRVR
jgi:hypothetical protein